MYSYKQLLSRPIKNMLLTAPVNVRLITATAAILIIAGGLYFLVEELFLKLKEAMSRELRLNGQFVETPLQPLQ